MTWYAWALVGVQIFSSALHILLIGKPRDPYSPTSALLGCVVSGLIIWAILSLAGMT